MTFIEITEKQSYLIDWEWRIARTAFLTKQFEQNFREDFFALSSNAEPKGHSTLHGCPCSLALKQQNNNYSISHNHNKLEIQFNLPCTGIELWPSKKWNAMATRRRAEEVALAPVSTHVRVRSEMDGRTSKRRSAKMFPIHYKQTQKFNYTIEIKQREKLKSY